MKPATPALAMQLVDRLKEHGCESIIVGGIAMEFAGFGATKDVDLMVPMETYYGLEEMDLERIEVISTMDWVTNGHFHLKSGIVVPFDLLNPEKFVGPEHSGPEFFAYVRRYASKSTQYGRMAHPSVVYYTRLLVPGPHGSAYVERIRADIDAGAPFKWVSGALRIARRFGTERTVKKRIEELKTILWSGK